MIEVEGKCGIVARVICDSISEAGIRLTTFEIEVPRIVWSEFMTHRMFSRNASSSRAIPFNKMAEQLNGIPVRFGKNVAGMADGGEHDSYVNLPANYAGYGNFDNGVMVTKERAWEAAKQSALVYSKAFAEAGYHKQISGRITEPFQCIKAVVSATEFSNFFWLRKDGAADPTIEALAQVMWEGYQLSEPQLLKAGEWHLPYVTQDFADLGHGTQQMFFLDDEYNLSDALSLEDAIKVSCARCAAVSYRNEDYGLEKCLQVYDRLVGADKKHSSAMEHVGTPMHEGVYEYDKWDFSVTDLQRSINLPFEPDTWQEGISHADRDGQLWSGNFRGFVQHRKMIAGENYIVHSHI